MERIHEVIINALLERDRIGKAKYGVTLHEHKSTPPTGCWHQEVYQELLDALQYISKQHVELQNQYKELLEKYEAINSNCNGASQENHTD